MITWVSYAFVLGIAASVNPCGFPMLPAYLSVFVGADANEAGVSLRLVRALRSAAAVSIGFGIVFAMLAAVFDAGLTLFMNWVPWVMVVMGAVFVVIGCVGVVRGHVPFRLPSVRSRRTDGSGWSMIGFGVSYAVASLTCSLPIFLGGVAGTFTRVGWATGAATFIAYAAGMSAVLAVVSVAVALARTSIVGLLRRAGHHIDRFASAVLIVVGVYLVYYWIVDIGGGAAPGPISAVEGFQGSLTGLLSSHRAVLAIMVGVLVVAAAGTVTARWVRHQDHEGQELRP